MSKNKNTSYHQGTGSVRIIGGHWRGRRLKIADRPGLRPTPDRLRETLFNWLAAHLPGAQCLDLFAGSGALGFEAASRGATAVTLVEPDQETARLLQQHMTLLEATQIQLMSLPAQQFLQRPPQAFDIIFLDPPFADDLLGQCLQIMSPAWLNIDARIYLETPAEQALPALPDNWTQLREQRAGQTRGHLFAVE